MTDKNKVVCIVEKILLNRVTGPKKRLQLSVKNSNEDSKWFKKGLILGNKDNQIAIWVELSPPLVIMLPISVRGCQTGNGAGNSHHFENDIKNPVPTFRHWRYEAVGLLKNDFHSY
jgi:hypothetical protein